MLSIIFLTCFLGISGEKRETNLKRLSKLSHNTSVEGVYGCYHLQRAIINEEIYLVHEMCSNISAMNDQTEAK